MSVLMKKRSGRIYERTDLGNSIDLATITLLKKSYRNTSDKNIVISPVGVLMLLSMAKSALSPGAREEIDRFLKSSSAADSSSPAPSADVDEKLSQAYAAFTETMSNAAPKTLKFANKVCMSNQYTVTKEFAETAQKHHSTVDTYDFGKAGESAHAINEWVTNKTEGTIKEAIRPGDISNQLITILINAIYFKSEWSAQFCPVSTKPRRFHISSSKVVTKAMMNAVRQSMNYMECPEHGFRMLELPYKEQGFRMLVVLPDEIDGLEHVLIQLSSTGILEADAKLRETVSSVKIHLDLPQFKVSSDHDITAALRQVGLSKMFSEPAPGLVKETKVPVSQVLQKANIEVDERGTEASACSTMMFYCSALHERPDTLKFKVDHPFLFFILYEDKILFAGTYTH